MKLNDMKLIMVATLLLSVTSALAADVALDYDFYKSRVEPIFTAKPWPLLCLPRREQQRLSLGETVAGAKSMVRRTVTEQFPTGHGTGRPG